MRISELLTEAIKARIDHPEDLVWQEGSKGAKRALAALSHIAKNPRSSTIKWDGSPSLIFGRNPEGQAILTDKSGFGAKGYDGKAKSQKHLTDMLAARKPGDPERAAYASKIGSLWPLITSVLPQDLVGYYTGDLLWVGRPPIEDNEFVFKPNKITYRIPVNSELGKRIAASQAGIVVHGFFPDDQTAEPDPIDDVSALQGNPKMMMLGTMTVTADPTDIPGPGKVDTAGIDQLIDPAALKAMQLSDLGAIIGKYVNFLAGQGINDYQDAPQGFLEWLPNSGVSNPKQGKINELVAKNKTGYVNLWRAMQAISNYKSAIKNYLDRSGSGGIKASLDGDEGHEGYVSATPSGKFKLVDRYKFMRK